MHARSVRDAEEEADLRLWAAAMRAGIPDALFWDLTVQEVQAVLEAQRDEERHATLRAALVAATIVNVNRKPGARLVQPHEFLREEPREEDYMDAETAASMMDRWAARQNATLGQGDAATVADESVTVDVNYLAGE